MQPEPVDHKKKYKTLKRKLKFLVYEHECFLEELRKAQRKLLKVSRDKSFLLDRLMAYEKTDDSSSDSDHTASSESDTEAKKDGPPSKKKKPPTATVPLHEDHSSLVSTSIGFTRAISKHSLLSGVSTKSEVSPGEFQKKKVKMTKKISKGGLANLAGKMSKGGPMSASAALAARSAVHMSREEVERHLEIKESKRPTFMSLEQTPHSLPDDIFSNENSNQEGDPSSALFPQTADDSDLIIDMPE